MPETLSYLYTTRAEVSRIFSTAAVDRRIRDDRLGSDDGGTDDQMDDCIVAATDEINLYAERFYDPADMVNNRLVRTWATYLAAYHLSLRRGNAPQYTGRRDQILEWLGKIHEGSMKIPRLAHRSNLAPGVSNYIIDQRYPLDIMRVLPTASIGGEGGERRLAGNPPLDSNTYP